MRALAVFLVWAIACSAAAAEPAVIGIDHMPLVVADVEQAARDYRQFGFAIKPGRLHDNGITNQHVKFPDGSGIELISAREATDDMTKRYRALLAQGEGPAYLAFHARDTNRLKAALDAAHIGYSGQGGLIELADPRFEFLFFVGDNRSKTDRPEHFAHANSAVAMSEVWIALPDPAEFQRLLVALGAVVGKETVFTPEPVVATVLNVTNGRVVLLPASSQRMAGRPVVGATFQVQDLESVSRALKAANLQPTPLSGAPAGRLLLPARDTHGIMLSFSR